MQRIVRFVATLAPLASSGLAQTLLTAEVRTVTSYGNFARDGAQQDLQSWATNYAIPSGLDSVGANAGNAFADTLVGWNVWTSTVTCDVSEQGGGGATSGPLASGTTTSTSLSNLQPGPHALRFKVRGPALLHGKLEVWASGIAFAGSTVTMAADVGDDSTVDFQLAADPAGVFARRQWDLTLDAQGELVVRIVTEARAALATGNTTYKTGISLRFTPGAFCDIAPYGASCGPALFGADDLAGGGREISLQLSQAPANAPGVLVAGTQVWSVTLPGTTCLLRTDPLLLLPFVTDGNGNGPTRKLRVAMGPFAVNLQDVLLEGSRLVSSNGLAVVCR